MDEHQGPHYQCLIFDVKRKPFHSLAHGSFAFVASSIQNDFPPEALREATESVSFINSINELPTALITAIRKGNLSFSEVGLTCQTVESNNLSSPSISKLPVGPGLKVTMDEKLSSTIPGQSCKESVVSAIDAENIKLFKHILKHRPDIRNEDSKNGTLLHLGAERADRVMVEVLLQYGANIDATQKDGLTPLHLAARYGHIEVIRVLLYSGANLEAIGKNGETPLLVAAENGQSEVVSILFQDFGANINAEAPKHCNGRFSSPLCAAIVNEHSKVIELLIQYGADTSVTTPKTLNSSPPHDEGSDNILQLALKTKNSGIFEQVLKHFPDVSKEVRKQVLFDAVYQKGKESGRIVEFLLQFSFLQPNDKDNFDLLNVAIYNNYLNVVRRLIEFGAKVNECKAVKPPLRKCREYTPIHTAARYAGVDMLQLLLQNGADINSKCCHGTTPIIDAVEFLNVEAVKLLLEHKANVRNIPGLISLAVKKQSYQVVESLLRYGGDANDSNSSGEPCVKIAAGFGHREIFELLMNHGADIHAKNRKDKSVLHEASEKGALEIVQIVLKRGGDAAVNCGDSFQNTPLMYAAVNGHETIVDVLLKHGAQVELQNKDGRTALSLSAWRGHNNIVKTLLKRDAKINSPDLKGETPLRLAVAEGKIEVVVTLLKNGAPVDYHTLNLAVSIQQQSKTRPVSNDVSMANTLLKFGHRIDCLKKSNNTFLHLISRHCNARYLQSILDHCFLNDISVIKSIINQFRTHYPTYLQKERNEEYGWDDVIELHLIKVSCAGFCDAIENSASICQQIQSKRIDYFRPCSVEVEALKKEQIANTCVSFFDILIGTENQIATYARNPIIQKTFCSDSLEIKFPLYAKNLCHHFEKGLQRKELVDQGFRVLSQVSPLPDVTLFKILEYLNNSDLRSLNRARGVLNP